MSEIARILDQMDRAFSGDAWHGPALMHTLEGITAESASKHSVPYAHSVWEIVNHIAAWNSIVPRKMAGETIEITTEMDWPPVWEASEIAWRRSLEILRASRERLRGAVQDLSGSRLDQIVPHENYSYYVLLHGLVQHDLYHAGQIAVLKKALG